MARNMTITVAVVRKSAGWIKGEERYVWTLYITGHGKRYFIRGASETENGKALEVIQKDARDLSATLGCNIVYRKAAQDGKWFDLPDR